METNERDCMKAKQLITYGFKWKKTKQGHKYWERVTNNLNNIKGKCEHKCGIHK